mgnify:CR=1 FL=1
MNLQKFTVKAQETVHQAAELAASKNHQGVEPPHLMHAFLSDQGGIVVSILQRLGANLDALSGRVDQAMDRLPVVTGASVSGQYVGTDLKKVFDRALAEAELLQDAYVSSEHLLVALAESKDAVGEALHRVGASTEREQRALEGGRVVYSDSRR